MSTNPPRKTFQPSNIMQQDYALLDFKNMTNNGKSSLVFNFNHSDSTSLFDHEFPILKTNKSFSNLYSSWIATARFPPNGTSRLGANNKYTRSGDSCSNNMYSNGDACSYNNNEVNSTNIGMRKTRIVKNPLEVPEERLIGSILIGLKHQESDDTYEGLIGHIFRGECYYLQFSQKDVQDENTILKIGDEVSFVTTTNCRGNVAATKILKKVQEVACSVNCLDPGTSRLEDGLSKANDQSSGNLHQGFISALKDGYGYIETTQRKDEIFFHYGDFDGDATTLELGQEIEYKEGCCSSARNVRLISKGTILQLPLNIDIYHGSVVRPLRSGLGYSGIIRTVAKNSFEGPKEYEFGIMGPVIMGDPLKIDDIVQFQIDSTGWAGNIVRIRQKYKATVDSIKGMYGFLTYEVYEGKKLFFHMSEVKDNDRLQVGDAVEFVLVKHIRHGKSFACNVVKIYDGQTRLERLISQLLDAARFRVAALRQQKAPDTYRKGVQRSRNPPLPYKATEYF